ncbi:MAG: mannosyl-glycoprotein endo-beta-N-acetylglucosamidase, partial [Staphylococcus warneri]|nr:mannosyl-glycoprotein endo-beta-N-acetylglucosamidase [Staphylococcus warneri]
MRNDKDQNTSNKVAKNTKKIISKGAKTLAKVKGLALWKIWLGAIGVIAVIIFSIGLIGGIVTLISDEL